MKKQKVVIDYVPQNKSLPYFIGALSIIAFVLGMMYSPLNVDYDQQTVSETKFFTIIKKDTVFIERKVNNPVINEDAYSDRNYGFKVRNHTERELRQMMNERGFKDLDNLDLFKLRRLWLLYNYNDMLMNVHVLTDFPVSMIYSFFIIEATTRGITSLVL